MKRFVLFISLLLIVFQVIYSQKVSNVEANQVGKKIEITYDLDCTSDVSVECSTDGGRTYAKLRYVNGAVGRSVNAGHNSIIWDVLAEMEQLVGDNICFRVNAMSGRGYENGHEWIDLGLSVKWATCNVGASTPEAYGNITLGEKLLLKVIIWVQLIHI